MASRSINVHSPLARPPRTSTVAGYTRSICYPWHADQAERLGTCGKITLCCAAQEPTTATVVTDDKEVTTTAKKSVKTPAKATAAAPAAKEAPARPKKAPAKPLPQMMEEDVIPSLKATLETQDDISQIELSFDNNRLEGSFLKKDIPYYFWAFFSDGVLTGPKGFSLSSHGSGASTVEPFLIDERKITDKLIVFWVEKRLAAQGILPVWKD